MWNREIIKTKLSIYKNKLLTKRNLFLVSLFLILYLFLYNLTQFKISPIEIRNECRKDNSGFFICERKFDVPAYAESVNTEIGNIYKNQSVIEKIANLSANLIQYSIGFKDNSSQFIWIKQHRQAISPSKESRGICPFPDGFKVDENGGSFKQYFTASEIPNKMRELATALNDCQHPYSSVGRDVDYIEKAERYDIFVSLTWLAHILIIILAIILTSLLLGIIKPLYKFHKSGFDDK